MKTTPHPERLHVHVDRKTMQKLRRRAKSEKRTLTACVHIALNQYLDRAESN